jgi:iron complex transport system substrate-binding protein
MDAPTGLNAPARRVRCEILDRIIELPVMPQRVVCLVAGWTETLWAMGLADRVVGVSHYCQRYVDTGDRTVVGDYLNVDEAKLDALAPDLILVTGGVQLGLARRWAKADRPVFVLPLPNSLAGIHANIRTLGALMNAMPAAHALGRRMQAHQRTLEGSRLPQAPTVYAELWFGRHPRMAGGLGFTHDIIGLVGGRNIFGDLAEAYPKLDLPAVAAAKPQVILLFHEEDDHPLDVAAWQADRGWARQWDFELIECGIEPGRNLIHDGPTLLDTVAWLQKQSPFVG